MTLDDTSYFNPIVFAIQWSDLDEIWWDAQAYWHKSILSPTIAKTLFCACPNSKVLHYFTGLNFFMIRDPEPLFGISDNTTLRNITRRLCVPNFIKIGWFYCKLEQFHFTTLLQSNAKRRKAMQSDAKRRCFACFAWHYLFQADRFCNLMDRFAWNFDEMFKNTDTNRSWILLSSKLVFTLVQIQKFSIISFPWTTSWFRNPAPLFRKSNNTILWFWDQR